MGLVTKSSIEIGLCLCHAERSTSLKVSALLQWVLSRNVPRTSAFVYAMLRGGWDLMLARFFNDLFGKSSMKIGLCLCNAERSTSLKVSVLLQWVLLRNVPRRSAFVYAMPRGAWALRLARCFNGSRREMFRGHRPLSYARRMRLKVSAFLQWSIRENFHEDRLLSMQCREEHEP